MIDKLKKVINWFPSLDAYMTILLLVLISALCIGGIIMLIHAPTDTLVLISVVVGFTIFAKLVEKYKLDIFDIFTGK